MQTHVHVILLYIYVCETLNKEWYNYIKCLPVNEGHAQEPDFSEYKS